MIKKTHFLAFVTVVMLLSSCAKRIAVPYSTVEKIVKVAPGMTTSDVSSTLGTLLMMCITWLAMEVQF